MELKRILEALLFSADKPLSPAELRQVLKTAAEQAEETEIQQFKKVKVDALNSALEELATEHEAVGRSYRLVCVAGSWQFVTRSDYAPWLRVLLGHKPRPTRLSQPALETLAIIAYRQPLTRSEMEQIRGVSVDGVMQTLTDRGLVQSMGRAEVVGRPMTYGTTPAFLEYFGLASLDDLPSADELRRLPVERPEELATAQPELFTASEEEGKESPDHASVSEGSDTAESPDSVKEPDAPEGEPKSSEADAEPSNPPTP